MGYKLGKTSEGRLVGVDERLVRVTRKAIELTTQDFTVFEGLRTLKTQQEYVKRGVSRTLNSKHLKQPDGFGKAVDLVPWIGGRARWEWGPIYPIAVAMRAASIAEGVSIRWGGVWDRRLGDLPDTVEGIKAAVKSYCDRHPGPDFIDGPHYELTF